MLFWLPFQRQQAERQISDVTLDIMNGDWFLSAQSCNLVTFLMDSIIKIFHLKFLNMPHS